MSAGTTRSSRAERRRFAEMMGRRYFADAQLARQRGDEEAARRSMDKAMACAGVIHGERYRRIRRKPTPAKPAPVKARPVTRGAHAPIRAGRARRGAHTRPGKGRRQPAAQEDPPPPPLEAARPCRCDHPVLVADEWFPGWGRCLWCGRDPRVAS